MPTPRSRTSTALAVLVALVCAVFGPAVTSASAAGRPAAETGTVRNPVREHAPDPSLTYHQGSYYLLSTQGPRITVVRAASVASLGDAPEKVIWQDSTPSRCCHMWAPELHRLNGRWYVYYTATTEKWHGPGHRMYVLESAGDDPLGPYQFKAELATGVRGLAIDGTVLQQDGGLYLLWSGTAGSALAGQNLYVAPMSNPWTVSGQRVLVARPTHPWERRPRPGSPATADINEAPAVLQRGGRTFVTFSASACESVDYALGMLTLRVGGDPLDPAAWEKTPTPVFTRSDADRVYGTGHNSFFTSPDGTEVWMAYHGVSHPRGTPTGACDQSRATRVQKVEFGADGTPGFGLPAASWQSTRLPAGDPGPRPLAAGRYRVTTEASGNALGVRGCVHQAGAEVAVDQYAAADCASWELAPAPAGGYRLTHTGSGRPLTTADCAAPDGGKAVTGDTGDQPCQRWLLDPVAEGRYRIANAASGRVLDVAGCSKERGAQAIVWPYWGPAEGCQVWRLERS